MRSWVSVERRAGGLRYWALLALTSCSLGFGLLAEPVQAVAGEQLVVFTASWCASCRDLMPVVERIGSEHGVPILLVDVDEPKSPRTVKSMGLSIPTKELPQIYLLQPGKSTSLLFDGENYLLGQRRSAQIQIQEKFNQLHP